MNSSLIPEKPLSISPSLAATLGLEEACLLSILTEAATYLPTRSHQGRHWWQLDQTLAQKLMPFWTDYDLERVSRNLKDKGVILLDSAPYTQSREICFAFDTNEAAHTRVAPSPAIASALPPTGNPTGSC
jgi:hypothetical protein